MTHLNPKSSDDGLPKKWDDSFMKSLDKRIAAQRGSAKDVPTASGGSNAQTFQDFTISSLLDPKFTPIRNLIPPPADNPDYNRPASADFDGTVDIYLETRQLLPGNHVEPSVILPVKEVFRVWQDKLVQGIERELRNQGTALNDDKLAEIADLGHDLATKGIATIQERTLGQNLEAAWVPVRPIVATESLMDNDHIGGMVYDSFYASALKQATEIQLLKVSNADGSNNAAITEAENELFLTHVRFLEPSMQVRDERKRAALVEEKANINRYADEGTVKDDIALAKAQINLLNNEIAGAWTSEERVRKESELSALRFTRQELQEFSDKPGFIEETIKNAASTLDWYADRQEKGEWIDSAEIMRLRERHAWLTKLQQPGALDEAIADYDSKLAISGAEFNNQPQPMTISANREKAGKLEQRIEVIERYSDEVGRKQAIGVIDFAIGVIDERLGLQNRIARELPDLRIQQQEADKANDVDRYVAVSSRIETWEQVTRQIEEQRTESDQDLLNQHNADIATKAGRHRHIMASAGSIIDSAFIIMLSDAGMSKSTIRWAAELMVEAIQDTPKFAPRAGFPVDGLRPAEDIIPANRLGEVFTASRNLPWQNSPTSDVLPKNGDKFVSLDSTMLEAIKVLSEPQGDENEDAKRLGLGVFLNRNTYTVRRIVDRWVQDGHIPALRDERIDPASEILLGYHVQAKDVLRAVDAAFSEGITSHKITFNPDFLGEKQQEAILGSESYALTPKSVQLMKDSFATAIRRMGATQAIDLEHEENLVPVTAKYKKGAEKLFMARQTEKKSSTDLSLPINGNTPITLDFSISYNFLAAGGTLDVHAKQGPNGTEIKFNIVSAEDVQAYRKRKEEQANRPAPKANPRPD